ncbi:hypothetical protein [Mesorhizobium sp. M1396]|uniref:hypothetical protein n=1 Tax=Mesorhizobium sp. M1396 TaxID=2957095 RepID=UPI00333CB0A5
MPEPKALHALVDDSPNDVGRALLDAFAEAGPDEGAYGQHSHTQQAEPRTC